MDASYVLNTARLLVPISHHSDYLGPLGAGAGERSSPFLPFLNSSLLLAAA